MKRSLLIPCSEGHRSDFAAAGAAGDEGGSGRWTPHVSLPDRASAGLRGAAHGPSERSGARSADGCVEMRAPVVGTMPWV